MYVLVISVHPRTDSLSAATSPQVAAADLIVVVYPVWWFGLPAMSKGWVDRVLNRRFTYEPSTLHGQQMIWVGLAGPSASGYATGGFDKLLDQQLGVGIAENCGISSATFRVVHNAHGEPCPAAIDELQDIAKVAA
jgi:putative NADPH-quinone reductase